MSFGGAVAQSGERQNRTLEVVGSNPICSTIVRGGSGCDRIPQPLSLDERRNLNIQGNEKEVEILGMGGFRRPFSCEKGGAMLRGRARRGGSGAL